MGIWLPVEVYERWPVLLPWVVRDPRCRGNKRKGLPDEWSSPDALGYLRDDNSLIKSLPRSLTVQGPKGSHVHGARMGTEFVAAHVWRVVNHDHLASRHPLLNSFVPNLVWLPGQIAKLTDVEDGVVQRTLQAMAYRIYREQPVTQQLRPIVEEAWQLIPRPSLEIDAVALDELNRFRPTDGFYRTRSTRLSSVINALEQLERGEGINEKVVTHRYAAGLPAVSTGARGELLTQLRRFQCDRDSQR
jgi:hypothetical protein